MLAIASMSALVSGTLTIPAPVPDSREGSCPTRTGSAQPDLLQTPDNQGSGLEDGVIGHNRRHVEIEVASSRIALGDGIREDRKSLIRTIPRSRTGEVSYLHRHIGCRAGDAWAAFNQTVSEALGAGSPKPRELPRPPRRPAFMLHEFRSSQIDSIIADC